MVCIIVNILLLLKSQENNRYLSIIILNVNNYGEINNIEDVFLLPPIRITTARCRRFNSKSAR